MTFSVCHDQNLLNLINRLAVAFFAQNTTSHIVMLVGCRCNIKNIFLKIFPLSVRQRFYTQIHAHS